MKEKYLGYIYNKVKTQNTFFSTINNFGVQKENIFYNFHYIFII
jgi:hypothetical protein